MTVLGFPRAMWAWLVDLYSPTRFTGARHFLLCVHVVAFFVLGLAVWLVAALIYAVFLAGRWIIAKLSPPPAAPPGAAT